MVGLLVVTHSSKIAAGIKELIDEMCPGIPFIAQGGTADGRLGADYEKIKLALEKLCENDNVLVLYDLGSSIMTTELIVDGMEEKNKSKVIITKAALVEGAITAGVDININKTIDEILADLGEISIEK